MTHDNRIAVFVRARIAPIAEAWEQEVVRDIPCLRRLERGVLLNHFPEFLAALAAWVEGRQEEAQVGFELLAKGHAVQRLAHGIDLATLSSEYAVLRRILFRELAGESEPFSVDASVVRLSEGMDLAVREAIRRYAEERDVILDRFLSILGHDLRNPLNAITLGATQIGETPCGERLHELAAAVIERGSRRMNRMIGDLLAFAHARMGAGIPVTPVPCDMGKVCQQVVGELRVANPKRLLRLDVRGDVEGRWDPHRVAQALSNLVGNALEHGQDPVEVLVYEEQDRQSVVTVVRNRGDVWGAMRGGLGAIVHRVLDPVVARTSGRRKARARSRSGRLRAHEERRS